MQVLLQANFSPPRARLRLIGEVDASVEALLGRWMDDVIDMQCRILEAAGSQATFVDGYVLRLLSHSKELVEDEGGPFVVRRPSVISGSPLNWRGPTTSYVLGGPTGLLGRGWRIMRDTRPADMSCWRTS